jgi:hypothetical protein
VKCVTLQNERVSIVFKLRCNDDAPWSLSSRPVGYTFLPPLSFEEFYSCVLSAIHAPYFEVNVSDCEQEFITSIKDLSISCRCVGGHNGT